MVSMSVHHRFILPLSSTCWGVVKSLHYSSQSSLFAELMALDSGYWNSAKNVVKLVNRAGISF